MKVPPVSGPVSSSIQLDDAWVQRFQKKHGRAPRVLQIGNIANNGYLNTKLLRSMGVEADLVCFDYYHVMGCPEWEEVSHIGDFVDINYPDWKHADVDFKRPEWFIQGPLKNCLDFLYCKFKAPEGKALAREQLERAAESYCQSMRQGGVPEVLGEETSWQKFSVSLCLNGFIKTLHMSLEILLQRKGFKFGFDYGTYRKLVLILSPLLLVPYAFSKIYAYYVMRSGLLGEWAFKSITQKKRFSHSFQKYSAEKANSLFRSIARDNQIKFGARNTEEEFVRVFKRWFSPSCEDLWIEILDQYDLVHAYSYEAYVPLLHKKRPFISFEHGTIRDLPFEKNEVGLLTTVVYQQSDHVFISNCDTIESARKLQLKNYTFLPHPMNEPLMQRMLEGPLRPAHSLRQGVEFLAFHPPRHYWSDVPTRDAGLQKGNHIFLRAFARFCREICPNARAVCVEFGQMVQKSKELVRSLGIEDRIVWVKPLTDFEMLEVIADSDVTVDQFIIKTMGSIPARAMGLKRPVLTAFDPAIHEWCFPEMPPLINCQTENEVFDGLKKIYLEPLFRDEMGKRGYEWYQKYHSWNFISREVGKVYERLLEEKAPG